MSGKREIEPDNKWLPHYQEASRRRRSRGWHRHRDNGRRRKLRSTTVALVVFGGIGIVGATVAAILARLL